MGSLWHWFLRGLKEFWSKDIKDSNSKKEEVKLKLGMPQLLQIHDKLEPARASYSLLAASPLAACSPRHIGPTTAALAPSALDSVFTKFLECQ